MKLRIGCVIGGAPEPSLIGRSVNKEKAGELKAQMEAIAEASALEGLTFRRSPAPGRVVSDTGTVDILSADKSSGHAAGFDDALVDEMGLLQERDPHGRTGGVNNGGRD